MDEAKLVAQIRAGDTTVWSAVVDDYGDRLLRSAYLLTGGSGEAEDLVQETLLQAAKSVGRFRGESGLYTWLHGILVNVTRTHQRRAARTVYMATPEPTEVVTAEQGGHLDAEATAAAVLTALRQLSPEHREVIVLHYYEQLPVEEIARRTGVGAGTVKSRLHYARQQLSVLIPPSLNPIAATHTH